MAKAGPYGPRHVSSSLDYKAVDVAKMPWRAHIIRKEALNKIATQRSSKLSSGGFLVATPCGSPSVMRAAGPPPATQVWAVNSGFCRLHSVW